jgi:regulatory protein
MRRTKKPTPRADAPEDPVAAARAQALKLLARREHARGELLEKLVARGHDRAVAAQVLDELAARRLLSEERFVAHLVSVKSGRGVGPLRIAAELRAKGVARDDAQAGLEASAADWAAECERARRKRFGAALPRDAQERGRQARFLQQRGFTAEQVRRALRGDHDEDQ